MSNNNNDDRGIVEGLNNYEGLSDQSLLAMLILRIDDMEKASKTFQNAIAAMNNYETIVEARKASEKVAQEHAKLFLLAEFMAKQREAERELREALKEENQGLIAKIKELEEKLAAAKSRKSCK